MQENQRGKKNPVRASQPGLAGAFFIDAAGTGMFTPFSLLFFLATTSLPLTRIGLGLSIAALVRIPATVAAGPLADRFGPGSAIVGSQLLQAAGFAGYLFVHGFWYLVAAAVLVQIDNCPGILASLIFRRSGRTGGPAATSLREGSQPYSENGAARR